MPGSLFLGGGGDVSGPGPVVDNAIARMDGTSGTLLQGYTSGAPTISDTGAVTFTEPVGASGLTIVGATQTASFPALDITQIWNNAGVTFTGAKINITSTASAAASLLLDLQVGSVSQFAVTKTGRAIVGQGTSALPSMTFSNYSTAGFYAPNSGDVAFGSDGSEGLRFSGALGLGVVSGAILWWSLSSTNSAYSNRDLVLKRGAAAVLQMGLDVNGAAIAQTFKAHDGITGTDRPGANLTFAGGQGTGAGAPGNLVFSTATALGTGTTAQTLSARLTLAGPLVTFADAVDMAFNATTGTKIGTATSQKIGFYNATPIVQGASIADASGGAFQDAEARTALNALISRIEALGLIATV